MARTKQEKSGVPQRSAKSMMKPAAGTEVEKRKYRHKSKTVALREIRKYQKDGKLLLPKASVSRVIDEILREMRLNDKEKLRMEKEARLALQEAGEAFIVGRFQNMSAVADHNGRVTIYPKDSKFVINKE